MNKKIQQAEVKTLSILMRSTKGLDAFSLFRRLDIPFTNFSQLTRRLKNKCFIEEKSDDFFVITDLGVLSLTQTKVLQTKRPWRKVPQHMLGQVIPKDEMYIPSTKLLDKKAFKTQ